MVLEQFINPELSLTTHISRSAQELLLYEAALDRHFECAFARIPAFTSVGR